MSTALVRALSECRSLAQRAWGSDFARSVSVLASGTVISQGLGIVAAPVLSRLYSPADFGALSMFLALLAPVAIVACLRYDMAIMLPERGSSEAKYVLALAITASALVGLLSLLFVVSCGGQIAALLNVTELGKWLVLLPFAVFFTGLVAAFRVWNLRQRRLQIVTLGPISNMGSKLSLQIGAGLVGTWGEAGLILGNVFGALVAALMVGGVTFTKDATEFRRAWQPRAIARAAKRYRDFPLFQSGGVLLNSLSRQLVVLLVGALFGLEAAGLYYMGFKLANVPLHLVSGAVGDSYYERATRERGTGNDARIMVRLVLVLGAVILPVAAVLAIAAPFLFAVALGPDWEEAGRYLQLLVPFFIFRFAIAPLARSFSVYEKQKAGLIWQIVFLTLGLTFISVGGIVGSIHLGLLLYSLSGCAMYLAMLKMCLGYSGTSLRDIGSYLASWV